VDSTKSFSNISENLLVILGQFDLLNASKGKNSALNAAFRIKYLLCHLRPYG